MSTLIKTLSECLFKSALQRLIMLDTCAFLTYMPCFPFVHTILRARVKVWIFFAMQVKPEEETKA